MTTPPTEATTDLTVAIAAVESAWNDHGRTKCNVGTGGDLSQCACICGEVLSECRPAVQAEHRRAHLAEAFAPLIRAERAAAWDEALQGMAWALANGPDDAALTYVRDHNPYRAEAERRGAS